MFPLLLGVTFAISLFVSLVIAMMFSKPVEKILERIIADEISEVWGRYLKFAIYVTGISSGVRIWDLEKYITPNPCQKDAVIVVLNNSRWLLEVYRTVIGTLQGIAWMLLVFFVFALIAFVIVRSSELKKKAEK